MKKSFALNKSIPVFQDKEINNPNMSNQYTRVKNVAKGEEGIKENKYQTYDFWMNF
jgi:hypothetical protein